VGIFDRALNADEIQTIFSAGKSKNLQLQTSLPGTAVVDNTFSDSGTTSWETVHFILDTKVADVSGNVDLVVQVPAEVAGKTEGFYAVKLANRLVSNLAIQTFSGPSLINCRKPQIPAKEGNLRRCAG